MNTNISLSKSLITCGSKLSNLLRIAKESPLQSPNNLHGAVEEAINQYLFELEEKRAKGDEKCVSSHVLDKLREVLQKFIEVDKANAESYGELEKKVKNTKDRYLKMISTSSLSLQPYDETSYNSISSNNIRDDEFELKYQKLGNEEKRCLFYLSLFPDGAEVKKRELIYWWLGMVSLPWHSQGGEVEGGYILSKFVDEGFIEHIVKTNKLSSTYRMKTNIRLKVLEKVAQELSIHRGVHPTQQGSFMELYLGNDQSNNPPQYKSNDIDALLNIGVNTFNQKIFDWISELENVLVLHLGSWKGKQQDKEEEEAGYIVVEDSEPLQKALKQLGKGKVRFLSLQGISGIVELPDSISNLCQLVVLDLRACHNLESLPQGIGLLQQLVHLDLSECYLLEHIPKEIASLSKLRVLKGFIINPHPNYLPSSADRSYANFSDLSNLKLLIKLTVRSRIMSFPSRQDLDVLCDMEELKTLGIAWVKQTQLEKRLDSDLNLDKFPLLLEKLQLQAIPQQTSSRLLELISKQGNTNRLEKLYIRGALGKLELHKYIFPNVKHIRLRYLPKLGDDTINLDTFRQSFPHLNSIQMSEGKHIINLLCDNNGVWKSM